jgi:cytochrome oxidase assembly protein ShyY1
VFRAALWTLRQRRYAALVVAGLIVASGCIGAGTFEMHRFHEKRHDNAVLKANAHRPAAPLRTSLVPLSGRGPAPSAFDIRYRTVTATGRYLTDHEEYVADQTQGGRQGFWVLTPLRTTDGVLLVVRGFVPATADETRPADVPAPPAATVQVTGWLDTAQTSKDQLGRLGHGEITAINPGQQASRLGTPTYQAYLTLSNAQPGTAGLSVVPRPGLSNPTGGAAEWQLFSYIIQWYGFAVLALALPFFISRSEVREARRRFLGIDPGAMELDAGTEPAAIGSAPSSGAELVARGRGELATLGPAAAARLARAERLADRYGRSLGIAPEEALAASVGEPSREVARPVVRSSANAPHRSEDEYHGSYNDYLWELALADGGLPDVFPGADAQPAEEDDR